jgi:DNA-binding HxlR family transcriptional regulator
MHPPSAAAESCSLSQLLDVVGDRWSMLILREALAGTDRYSDFQVRLQIATDTLASRLRKLVEAGILERRNDAPETRKHDRYSLTSSGHSLTLALIPLQQWARERLPSDAPDIDFVDAAGEPVTMQLVDSRGRSITADAVLTRRSI